MTHIRFRAFSKQNGMVRFSTVIRRPAGRPVLTTRKGNIMEAKMSDSSELKLFSPLQLGAISLSHRVVHGPTTRLRSNPDDSPSAMMSEYYGQRSSKGGLI